jgi:hypothetical protein
MDWFYVAEYRGLYFGSCYNGVDLSDSEMDGGKHKGLYEYYRL